MEEGRPSILQYTQKNKLILMPRNSEPQAAAAANKKKCRPPCTIKQSNPHNRGEHLVLNLLLHGKENEIMKKELRIKTSCFNHQEWIYKNIINEIKKSKHQNESKTPKLKQNSGLNINKDDDWKNLRGQWSTYSYIPNIFFILNFFLMCHSPLLHYKGAWWV